MAQRRSICAWIGTFLDGPIGYAAVVALLLLYAYLAFTPFQWDPPKRVHNGAVLTRQGISFSAPGILRSPGPPPWLPNAIRDSELTIHLKASTGSLTQRGPARIFTVSRDPNHRNLTIAQDRDKLVLRLRTTATTLDGQPDYRVPGVFVDARSHSVTIDIKDRQLTIRIDDNVVLTDQLPSSPLSNWNPSFRMALGNELTGDRPWVGELGEAVVRINEQQYDYSHGEFLERPAAYWPQPSWERFAAVFDVRRWTFSDAVLNFLCFIPLGFILAFLRPTRGSIWLAVTSAAVLSLTVEAVQIGIPERNPSLLDWLLNSSGAASGAGSARVFAQPRLIKAR